MTTFPGIAALFAPAIVSPEHMPPTMATTRSVLTRRSAALAAVVAAQPPSAVTNESVPPLRMPPCSLTCRTASSIAEARCGVMFSIGPVNPPRKPMVTF
jgi:hypothetical protein